MANAFTRTLQSIVSGTGRWSAQDIDAAVEAGDPATIFGSGIATNMLESFSPAELYATQPHLRTVVSFVARNGAQLGRQVFSVDADGNRERIRSTPLTAVLDKPNEYQTGYDLFDMLFTELALYDFALWVPTYRNGKWAIDPIPGEWIVGLNRNSFNQPVSYKIQPTGHLTWYSVNASDAVVFRGYNSHGFVKGSSAVLALKNVLQEQISSAEFRRQMWVRGGRVGMFMTRPADAPAWSPKAKSKFVQSWKANWAGSGADAGSTPLLEDGMTLQRVGFNAKEEQWAESTKLSMVTCAAAFHVPPAMIGVDGYNSFASVKEFRKMLYTETLGPLIAQVEETINTFLLPLLATPRGQYLELNIAEKLQGDFEEQAATISTAVGAPWMTRNEARSKLNLAPLDGGDELITPLNVLIGGQASPQDGGTGAEMPIDPTKASQIVTDSSAGGTKARRPTVPAGVADDLAHELNAFFKRQRAGVIAALKRKAAAPSWWDAKKWDAELSGVLLPHLLTGSAAVAKEAAKRAGVDPDNYSTGQTTNFLKAVADSRASAINSTTRDGLIKAIDDGEDEEDAVDSYYGTTNADRADVVTKTLGTMVAGWAVTEMARQLLGDKGPTKTWITGPNPRADHAAMDGETVGLDEKFSNGADWPGDPVLGAEGVSNCNCSVDISYNN